MFIAADVLLQSLIDENETIFNSIFNKSINDYIFCCFMVSSIDQVSWLLSEKENKASLF